MECNWLIEDGPFEEDINPLIQEINRQGYPLQIVKYEPFQSGEYRYLYPEDACVIFYGSINLATQLQRQTSWIPGPLVNWSNYKCSTYYAYFGQFLLNQEYLMMPYQEICRRKLDICKMFRHIDPENMTMFIRPDDGRKTFGGHVVSNKDFIIQGGPVGHLAKPETLCVVADPKLISYEWRIVIADRKAISGSQYRRYHNFELNKDVPTNVFQFAESIAESCEWQPDRLYTMDICSHGPYNKLYLLEINSFCCAGLYSSNPEPIVKEVSRIALEEWDDNHGNILLGSRE